ncbi:MAG: hypothetical protein AAB674_01055 [Patescibacteria group bacterium]
MNTTAEKIKNKILVRVYILWFLKRVIPLIILQILILALALKIFANNVFVSSVLQNVSVAARSGYWEFLKYLSVAFLGTRPLIQVAILIGLGIGALIIRDVMRSFMTYKSMWMRE